MQLLRKIVAAFFHGTAMALSLTSRGLVIVAEDHQKLAQLARSFAQQCDTPQGNCPGLPKKVHKAR